MRHYSEYDSPLGTLYLLEERGQIQRLSYEALTEEELKGAKEGSEILEECKRQLDLYFEGSGQAFDLPLNPQGTDFQKKVWRALYSIPYGETRSYSQLAKQMGEEKSARAIGRANHKNPIVIIIPCHRVLGKYGSLVGYSGGLERKKKLLDLEGFEK